jgi:hypothetical protein
MTIMSSIPIAATSLPGAERSEPRVSMTADSPSIELPFSSPGSISSSSAQEPTSSQSKVPGTR